MTQPSLRNRLGQSPYLEILARPGALRFSAAGLVGRMPMSMFGLGTVLLISSVTGRYGLAGAVAGAGSVGYAACGPQVARLADRHGQHRVLRPLAVLFAIATAGLVACAELGAPVWALVVSGGLAGASMPSLGSMVRARWSALLGESPRLHTAFALESVVDEMIYVVGPAVVTLLATEVYAPAGVIVAAALCLIGTLLFAAQRRSQPATRLAEPRARMRRARMRRAGAEPGAARPGSESRAARSGSWLPAIRVPAPGLITLAPVYACLGAMFSAFDLSTVDFAQQHGHKPLAGVIIGCYALGSAIGGFWYGSRTWQAPLPRRFATTLCVTVAGVAVFWAMPGLLALAMVVLVSGLTISPTFIAGYGVVERQAPTARRTEAMAWLSSTVSVGVAAGSAISGQIIDAGGARWGYAFAAACGAGAATACLTGIARLRLPRQAEWADARA
jgi:MFS family permease